MRPARKTRGNRFHPRSRSKAEEGTSGGFDGANDGSGRVGQHAHERLGRNGPAHVLGRRPQDRVDQHPALRRQRRRDRHGLHRPAAAPTSVGHDFRCRGRGGPAHRLHRGDCLAVAGTGAQDGRRAGAVLYRGQAAGAGRPRRERSGGDRAPVAGDPDRRGCRHRHESRQRSRHRGGGAEQLRAHHYRPRRQHSPDRRRRRADHGAARTLPDPGVGGRRPAGLDRRRGHRHRSADRNLSDRQVRRRGRPLHHAVQRPHRRDSGLARRRLLASQQALGAGRKGLRRRVVAKWSVGLHRSGRRGAMNQLVRPHSSPIRIGASACPHDCPSTCALEVEVLDERTIGRVRGAGDNDYTAGVICAKVARYAERVHHPGRLLAPLRRKGDKGSGEWETISWNDALGLVAEAFTAAEQRHGTEAVWPYYYAGTMGLVMRDGIHRLRHVKKYSGFHSTICVNPAFTGFAAGTGRIAGADPREIAKSDLVVIWGTNAVNTQVNVMTHAVRARKERGAKIVAVDIYMNGTMEQADLPLMIRPGTDGALACAVMHCLFRDGRADWDYLDRFTDAPRELESHVRARGPQWASRICGAPVETIEEFARLVGATKRAFFRLGYGFARSRNGAVNMHAASCIPAVTGAWRYEGGGAFHNNADIYHWNKTMIEGFDMRDRSVRMLDQSRIGAILCGEKEALADGPPVTALLIQNTNPVSVAPDQEKVKRGF